MAFTYQSMTLNRATTHGQAVPGVVTMHCYKTTDPEATVLIAGYFNPVAAHFAVNDVIYGNLGDRTTLYHITAVSPNVIVVVHP